MSTTAANVIDLDAAIRESSFPDGIQVPYKGTTYVLPAELPLDVFDPLLSPDFDLVGLIKTVLGEDGQAEGDLGDAVISVLFKRPNLPLEVRDTIYASLALLFGEDQWTQFQAQRPGVATLTVLIKGLFTSYGVALGEAFGSGGSSESDGDSSKETSSSTTESTPAEPSDAPEPETASSESAD